MNGKSVNFGGLFVYVDKWEGDTMFSKETYNDAVTRYFYFLDDEFGYNIMLNQHENTRLYDVEYTNGKKVILISYEVFGDGVKIIIFSLKDGKKPDYDDKTNTIHLSVLSKRIIKDTLIADLY